jgi:hypothetical protein
VRYLSSRRATAALVAAFVAALATTASADAPPVGRLTKGPVTTISTKVGSLVALALPSRPASTGLVWREARDVPPILNQITETEVDGNIVAVYKAVHTGTATVIYALTLGETAKVHATARFKILVT